jgi:hypothetical protein
MSHHALAGIEVKTRASVEIPTRIQVSASVADWLSEATPDVEGEAWRLLRAQESGEEQSDTENQSDPVHLDERSFH